MENLYLIKNNENEINFLHISKQIESGGNIIKLTVTESLFLLKLCQDKIKSISTTPRKEMEGIIWDDQGVDRAANLNQVICTLRKKISHLTDKSVIITQPKKGYSFAEDIHIQIQPPQSDLSNGSVDIPKKMPDRYRKKIKISKTTESIILLFLVTVIAAINMNLFSIIFRHQDETRFTDKTKNNHRIITTNNGNRTVITCVNVESGFYIQRFIGGLTKQNIGESACYVD